MHKAFLKASSEAKKFELIKSRIGEDVGIFSTEQSCPEF